MFALDTITYTITSFALNLVAEKKKNFPKMVTVGAFLFFISLMLSGPCPGILPDSVLVIASGILLSGISGAFINNNVVSAIGEQSQRLNICEEN